MSISFPASSQPICTYRFWRRIVRLWVETSTTNRCCALSTWWIIRVCVLCRSAESNGTKLMIFRTLTSPNLSLPTNHTTCSALDTEAIGVILTYWTSAIWSIRISPTNACRTNYLPISHDCSHNIHRDSASITCW